MTISSRRFGAWVIASKPNAFQTARIKLTAFYIGMIAIILCIFSVSLYFEFSKNLRGDLDGEIIDQNSQTRVIDQTINHLKATLIIIDGAVLIVISILSYVLAGRTLKPIEHALAAQKQFSADASHEFRTPLSIMKSEFEVALGHERITPSEAKLLMRSGIEEIDHMSSMIDQLLKISQGETTQQRIIMKPIHMAAVVQECAHTLHKVAQNKNITVTIAVNDTSSILGNFGALRDMVLNLLKNALDYTPSDGAVVITINGKGSYQELTFRDTGIGIEAKDLPHLFERFYKADNARSLRSNSSGLGLSIVHEIVQSHNGTITIQSVPAQGTLVTVLFPSTGNTGITTRK